MAELTANDPKSWLQTVWRVLDEATDECSTGPVFLTEEEDNDLKTAMAWIAEELGVDPTDPDL